MTDNMSSYRNSTVVYQKSSKPQTRSQEMLMLAAVALVVVDGEFVAGLPREDSLPLA